MGMYTGLRGSITFKQSVAQVLQEVGFDWQVIAYHIQSEAAKAFASKGRSGFIPRGALCYMPSNWDSIVDEWIDETTYSFACSLKNYDGEIEAFLQMLPDIADYWELEELYEEAESAIIHSCTKEKL